MWLLLLLIPTFLLLRWWWNDGMARAEIPRSRSPISQEFLDEVQELADEFGNGEVACRPCSEEGGSGVMHPPGQHIDRVVYTGSNVTRGVDEDGSRWAETTSPPTPWWRR